MRLCGRPGARAARASPQAPNLGWNRLAVEDLFAQALSELRRAHQALPVGADNEANLAAMADLWFGSSHDRGDSGRATSFLLVPWLASAAEEELMARVASDMWMPGSGRLRALSSAADAARGAAARVVREVRPDPTAYAPH
ncbi:hypothetical protein [Streptomyces sp. NPDC002676]